MVVVLVISREIDGADDGALGVLLYDELRLQPGAVDGVPGAVLPAQQRFSVPLLGGKTDRQDLGRGLALLPGGDGKLLKRGFVRSSIAVGWKFVRGDDGVLQRRLA